ncbi:MAG: Ca-activated chloride channel family protein [Thermoproteota archaeon]|jgi:Ca-activated chloride channel family protein
MTGGKSYYANSTGSLENILTDIQKLEKTEIKSEGQIVYKELYYQYLLIGVFLFMFVEIIRKFLIREVV